MKNRDEMVNDLLERRDKYVAEQRRKRNMIVRSTAAAVCVCLVVSAGVLVWNKRSSEPARTEKTEQTKTNGEIETVPNNSDPTISLDGLTGQDIWHVDALYDRGYNTIEELLKVSDLIVRATPVAIESKSEVGCHVVLRVEEADRDGVTEIRVVQLRDKHLLKIGEEVVLVLQKDFDDGYYFVPGGGDGIFRTDDESGQIKGKLLDSLTEKTHTDKSKLTFEDIFDLLVKNK